MTRVRVPIKLMVGGGITLRVRVLGRVRVGIKVTARHRDRVRANFLSCHEFIIFVNLDKIKNLLAHLVNSEVEFMLHAIKFCFISCYNNSPIYVVNETSTVKKLIKTKFFIKRYTSNSSWNRKSNFANIKRNSII